MILKIVLFPLNVIAIGLIYCYRLLAYSFIRDGCIYLPTCSMYGIKALWSFGIGYGGWLTVKRIVKCRPKMKGGYDYVPANLKGDYKWTC